MRVVLDTNVVASGVFFGGVPGRILAAWAAGDFTLVLSPQILAEYRRVGEESGADISRARCCTRSNTNAHGDERGDRRRPRVGGATQPRRR